MTGYHTRCDSEDCSKRCRRPGCLEPGTHWLLSVQRQSKKWVAFHQHYDCTVPRVPLPNPKENAAARQAIEELNPNMTPSDVAVARRVISKMLDRLEQLEHTTVTVVQRPPLLLTEPKDDKPRRLIVVASPRPITNARAQHEQWLAQRKERTA